MESSEYIDRTLGIVRDMHERYGCVRAVIQAYLLRSEADVEDLNRRGNPGAAVQRRVQGIARAWRLPPRRRWTRIMSD